MAIGTSKLSQCLKKINSLEERKNEKKEKEYIVDSSKYLVLDVETNGLSSIRDDLLSISIYKPDTDETYDRFLPLELQGRVLTSHINGITKDMLKGSKCLDQEEVDYLIEHFEIKKRKILTYGEIDKRFIKQYFHRHRLLGFEHFDFYNFKHDILSSKFSEGNITKDNLCSLYNIENVTSIHSGKNDCKLEWELYREMNGNRLIVTNNTVFELNNQYIVPVSYISNYPNFKYFLPNLPKIECKANRLKEFEFSSDTLQKFPTNFNGMIIEHLINSMLHVEKVDSSEFLLENKAKLKYVGKLPSVIDIVPMVFKEDGTVRSVREQDKKTEENLNKMILFMKESFSPLIEYIKNLLVEERILSQELVVNREHNVLALCDLSTSWAIMEIKASSYSDVKVYANQLFFESNGRKCYILQTDWSNMPKRISIYISEISFEIIDAQEEARRKLYEKKEKIDNDKVELVSYSEITSPVVLKCKECGYEWKISYKSALRNTGCPECKRLERLANRQNNNSRRIGLSEEEKEKNKENYRIKREKTYIQTIYDLSEGNLCVLEYTGAKEKVVVRCQKCNRKWSTRADHLKDRCFCSRCRRIDRYKNNYLG